MTTEPTLSPNAARLERTYDAPAELIWELWTTAAGLAEWFAPDGFESRVSEIELRPGGQLRFIMTATAPEQVAFMRNTGNPLSIEVRKTFAEVAPPTRLSSTMPIAATSSTTSRRRSSDARCDRKCQCRLDRFPRRSQRNHRQRALPVTGVTPGDSAYRPPPAMITAHGDRTAPPAPRNSQEASTTATIATRAATVTRRQRGTAARPT
jgi:Activator of Hsp90 ATPase homolog 1-like protein